jgi:hypothetical protein
MGGNSMQHNRFIKICAAAMLLCLTGCGAGRGDAVLIGKWRLAAGGDCPIDHLTFTRNSMTKHVVAIGVDPAYETVNAISYPAPEPGKAFVQGTSTGAGIQIYLVADHDHVSLADNDACRFERDV